MSRGCGTVPDTASTHPWTRFTVVYPSGAVSRVSGGGRRWRRGWFVALGGRGADTQTIATTME